VCERQRQRETEKKERKSVTEQKHAENNIGIEEKRFLFLILHFCPLQEKIWRYTYKEIGCTLRLCTSLITVLLISFYAYHSNSFIKFNCKLFYLKKKRKKCA